MSEFSLTNNTFAITASAAILSTFGHVVFNTWGIDEPKSKPALVTGAIIYFSGIIVLALATFLWKDDRSREGLAGEIDSGEINASGLFGLFSTVLIMVGMLLLTKYLYMDHSKNTLAFGISIFVLGYFGVASSASMSDRRFESFSTRRLAWNLPGVLAIIAGVLSSNWQKTRNHAIGPSVALYTTGFAALTIGNSWILF